MPPFRCHRRPFRQNLFYFYLLAGSQIIKKNLPQRPPLPPPFRHLIFQFGRMINTYVSKNNKVITHQYKSILKTLTTRLHQAV